MCFFGWKLPALVAGVYVDAEDHASLLENECLVPVVQSSKGKVIFKTSCVSTKYFPRKVKPWNLTRV